MGRHSHVGDVLAVLWCQQRNAGQPVGVQAVQAGEGASAGIRASAQRRHNQAEERQGSEGLPACAAHGFDGTRRGYSTRHSVHTPLPPQPARGFLLLARHSARRLWLRGRTLGTLGCSSFPPCSTHRWREGQIIL